MMDGRMDVLGRRLGLVSYCQMDSFDIFGPTHVAHHLFYKEAK